MVDRYMSNSEHTGGGRDGAYIRALGAKCRENGKSPFWHSLKRSNEGKHYKSPLSTVYLPTYPIYSLGIENNQPLNYHYPVHILEEGGETT